MERLIDEKCYLYGSCKCQTAGCVVLPDEGCPVYRYFKDLIIKDYENRLKADMVAMLTDLMMDIGELDNPKYKIVCNTPYEVGKGECLDLIQERINALRGNTE